MAELKILRTVQECVAWRRALGPQSTVGFVPTMGALHEGHGVLLTRMKSAIPEGERVLSIFVNPTQFGPTEDLAKYPRTLDADLKIAQNHGVTAVFFPSPEEMYPAGFSTFVEENQVSHGLCGALRPGHFRGVTTVVLKLFNLVGPDLAWFGLKDVQQFFVLKKMVADLNLDVKVIGQSTVREADGLALSSRNRYLSPDERKRAASVSQALFRLRESFPGGENDLERMAMWREQLNEERRNLERGYGFTVQYLEKREFEPGAHVLVFAGILGGTRLIDNVFLNQGCEAGLCLESKP